MRYGFAQRQETQRYLTAAYKGCSQMTLEKPVFIEFFALPGQCSKQFLEAI